MPAGWLASKFGSVKVTGISTAFASMLTILTPVLLFGNVYVMILLRLTIGVMQVADTHHLLRRNESRMTILIFAGYDIG